MFIRKISCARLQIPLVRPFITALRRADYIEDIIVVIELENGMLAYGGAAATPAITGESPASIIAAIQLLAAHLCGKDLRNFEELLQIINNSLVRNSSAKAALDIAIHDALAKYLQVPLYRLLGGGNPQIKILATVSINSIPQMVSDAQLLVAHGFTTLKLKLGVNQLEDVQRVIAIRQALGPDITIVTDANQGWDAKAALAVIDSLIENDLKISMVEQPVAAWDYANLAYVRANSRLPIYADEAIFNVGDALKIISGNLADGINIKLMKSGGIHQARTIYDLASAHRLPCMAGCMLESPVSLTAMASFVASRANFKFIDLDPITMISTNPVNGGVSLNAATLTLSDAPGLGIEHISDLEFIS